MATSIIDDSTNGLPTDADLYRAHAERADKLFLRYWSLLKNMREAGELPAWVLEHHPNVGREVDYIEHHDARRLARRAACGMPTSPRYYLSTWPSTIVTEREGHVHVYSGAAINVGRHIDLHELMPSQLASLAAKIGEEARREQTAIRLMRRQFNRTTDLGNAGSAALHRAKKWLKVQRRREAAARRDFDARR